MQPRGLCAVVFVGLAAVGLAPAGLRAEDAPPVAVAVHLTEEGESARLSFDLSAPVEGVGRPIGDPDRILVDVPEVNFQIDPAIGGAGAAKPGGLVKAFRFGLISPGKSRVVIELARPACLTKVETRPIAKGDAPSRLNIEFKACDGAAFAAAVTAALPPPSAPEPTSTPSAPPVGQTVIVLDPGHGGVDGGAYGPHGAMEKKIVYDYALELKRRLEANPRFKVVMTRKGDEFVSLEDRVQVARDAEAALLISIHADTLPGASAEVSGTTVYTCSDRASDAEAARIAEHENAADKAAGRGEEGRCGGRRRHSVRPQAARDAAPMRISFPADWSRSGGTRAG